MSTNNTSSKKAFLEIFWPIESYENKKFIPMALMMAFILINYVALRSIKDSLVVVNIGAEAVSFLKLYFVTPSAVLLMMVYTKLYNILNPRQVFNTITIIFIVTIAAFALVIYPNADNLHASPETIERLAASYPYVKWLIRIMGKWVFAAIYIVAEMWGSMMVSLLFWQFANQVTATNQAKRFYAMFGLISNIGVLLAALYLYPYLLERSNFSFVTTRNELSPMLLMVSLLGLVVLYLYKWVNDHVLTDPKLYNPAEISSQKKKKKAKLSFGDSIKMILTSKYLGLIAMLVFSYGVSINLVEGVWKSKVKEMYPSVQEYAAFTSDFFVYQSIAAIAFMLVGSNILRKVSWLTAALLTPVMILVTGVAFFSFVIFDSTIGLYFAAFFGTGPLALAVIFGLLQNILSKGAKYSLFDATKEMSYIPLDDEMKSKGKAAVDVIGGRLGKAGGGFIQSTFFTIMPAYGFVEASPYFAGIFFVIMMLWLLSVKMLSHEYYHKLAEIEE